MARMESDAKDILDDRERLRLEKVSDEQKPKDTRSIGADLESLHGTSLVKTDLPEIETDTTGPWEDADGITRGNTWNAEVQKECDMEREKNLPSEIEGDLRRSGKYRSMKEYVPLSRDEGLIIEEYEQEEEDEAEDEAAYGTVEDKTLEQTMLKKEGGDDTVLSEVHPLSSTKNPLVAMRSDDDFLTSDPQAELDESECSQHR